MERKKIAISCFIGGALFVVVALKCAPMFWWLAFPAGLAAGYLSYEFREVLRAIPVAWRKSHRGVSNWWLDTRKWSAEPHPIAYFYMITVVIATLAIAVKAEIMVPVAWRFKLGNILLSFMTVFMYAEIAFFCMLPILVLVILLAFIGSRIGEKCFWFPFIMIEDKEQESEAKKLKKKGYRKEVLTGKNFFRWLAKGISLTILFFVWIAWKYLFIEIGFLFCFLRRFGWELFKLIHSKKRVLCAIDETIGGAIAFFCFASTSLTLPQQILVVFFGGLLGAVIGVLNYEIISKRLLHLAPMTNKI